VPSLNSGQDINYFDWGLFLWFYVVFFFLFGRMLSQYTEIGHGRFLNSSFINYPQI
jgi:hypothetical protein